MSIPKCSFIVSAYNRPDHLACCLASLKIQTEQGFEVIVTDNDPTDVTPEAHGTVVLTKIRHNEHITNRASTSLSQLPYAWMGYMNTAREARDCYESANIGAREATGEYLCFPSDDSYYPPRFLELMLHHADGADLIYCNMVWDGRTYGPGEECIALVTAPVIGKIDKTGFLIRRSVFPGFPGVGPDGKTDRCADGQMIEQVVRGGASVKKVDIFGVFHS